MNRQNMDAIIWLNVPCTDGMDTVSPDTPEVSHVMIGRSSPLKMHMNFEFVTAQTINRKEGNFPLLFTRQTFLFPCLTKAPDQSIGNDQLRKRVHTGIITCNGTVHSALPGPR